VVWDRQGPFVVETDESASVKARRIRQARAMEAGLRRQQLVERVEAVEADLLALMAVAPVPERALRSAIEEARALGIPKGRRTSSARRRRCSSCSNALRPSSGDSTSYRSDALRTC